jgi:hypothetical protein
MATGMLKNSDADRGFGFIKDERRRLAGYMSRILESYLLRRAVCNLGTKNYNGIFLGLARNLRKEGFSVAWLKELLHAQTAGEGDRRLTRVRLLLQ